MSEPLILQALRDSVSDVLEKMFFVQALGESPDPEKNGPAPAEIAARLTFDGDPPGSLTLRMTSTAARSIAADFLGDDKENISDQQIAEVVCELANMICGSVLSRVESATTFNLASPQIVDPAEHRAGDPGATCYTVELSNGSLTVNVTTGSPTCLERAQFVS